jgi:spore maturation protein SpmB
MLELDKLNPRKGVATNAMCTFLAINTSGVAVLPLTVIGLRATLGAQNLTGIVLPTLLATSCSTVAAIVVVKLVQRLPMFAPERYPALEGAGSGVKETDVKGMAEAEAKAELTRPRASALQLGVIAAIAAAIAWGLVRQYAGRSDISIFGVVRELLEGWFLPILMIAIVMAGFSRSVRVYESVIAGAKEAFGIAVSIIPFMVAILVAIGMFRASGAMDILVRGLNPITSAVGFPAEVLPLAMIRPLSGSGATAVLTDLMKAHGPDSFIGFLGSVLIGSFETTFYVLAVYFGSIGVRATRHTILACLAADSAGIAAALVFARLFY